MKRVMVSVDLSENEVLEKEVQEAVRATARQFSREEFDKCLREEMRRFGGGVKVMRNDIEYPLQSLKNTLPFSVRDWGQEKREAWIWGVICGWDDDCFEEFNQKFGWTDETWQRLKRLHNKFEKLAIIEEELFS